MQFQIFDCLIPKIIKGKMVDIKDNNGKKIEHEKKSGMLHLKPPNIFTRKQVKKTENPQIWME